MKTKKRASESKRRHNKKRSKIYRGQKTNNKKNIQPDATKKGPNGNASVSNNQTVAWVYGVDVCFAQKMGYELPAYRQHEALESNGEVPSSSRHPASNGKHSFLHSNPVTPLRIGNFTLNTEMEVAGGAGGSMPDKDDDEDDSVIGDTPYSPEEWEELTKREQEQLSESQPQQQLQREPHQRLKQMTATEGSPVAKKRVKLTQCQEQRTGLNNNGTVRTTNHDTGIDECATLNPHLAHAVQRLVSEYWTGHWYLETSREVPYPPILAGDIFNDFINTLLVS